MNLVLGNVLQPLIDVFEQVLLFFHDSVGVGWGLSIILMTFVIRILLLPLTLKQSRSMQTLQRLQPQIKELQAKYKDDKQRLQQETMKFYQENKVNPLASCLPLVAQMPVFISLFYMLRKDLRHDICPDINPTVLNTKPCGANNGADFLFIPDLTNKATGAVLVVLILMYVSSQLVSGLLMTVSTDKTQRNLMLALPLVFVVFILSFPAGLIVYWITTNVWTIVQQQIVKKRVGPMVPATAGASHAGAPPGGGGGLLSRLKPASSPAVAPNGGGPETKPPPTAKPASNGRSTSGPPPSARKKKKRSGRRR